MPERPGPLFKPDLLVAIREGRKKKVYPRIRKGECQTSPSHLARRIIHGIAEITASDCWIWGRHLSNGGYAKMTILGRSRLVHREVWFLVHGDTKSGLCVCHKCDNPACVNPSHLFLATHQENMQDCVKKGRHAPPPPLQKGEKNPASKLSRANVDQIRDMLKRGYTQAYIASSYGICQAQVSNIKHRKQWK